MIIDLHVPPSTVDLIRRVQQALPDFIVLLAGGYLRDLYRGVSPKDIDIFLIPKKPISNDEAPYMQTRVIAHTVSAVGCNIMKVSSPANYCPEIKDRGIHSILYFEPPTGLEINIMFCVKPMDAYDLAATFDYTVNQIVMTAGCTVVVTQGFLDDFEDKKLRLTYPTQGNPFVEERLLKFMRKFPDFTLIATFGEDPFSFGD